MGGWGDGEMGRWGDGEMVSHSRGSSPAVREKWRNPKGRLGDGETRGQGELLV